MPVYYATGSRTKATLAATASGFAEPVGALIGYVILSPSCRPSSTDRSSGSWRAVMVFLSRMNCCRRPSVTPKATKRLRYGSGHGPRGAASAVQGLIQPVARGTGAAENSCCIGRDCPLCGPLPALGRPRRGSRRCVLPLKRAWRNW